MIFEMREPFNGLTHLFGALISVGGLGILIQRTLAIRSIRYVVSFAIYGSSLVLLYTASAIYHLLSVSEKATKILRYIDHIMIYILIAGTYTPLCLISLWIYPGWILFVSIWSLAMAGIISTGFWLNKPRWLSSLIYTLMGWLIIITTPSLISSITFSGFKWLLGGGIFYSIGGLIYGVKKPDFLPRTVGFHGIFHLFILAGSFCHFWLIYKYIP